MANINLDDDFELPELDLKDFDPSKLDLALDFEDLPEIEETHKKLGRKHLKVIQKIN
jgi:hypothetical protein